MVRQFKLVHLHLDINYVFVSIFLNMSHNE